MTIEYHPAVADELGEIRDYYNERLPGLGREFIDEFERQVFGSRPPRDVGWSSSKTFVAA